MNKKYCHYMQTRPLYSSKLPILLLLLLLCTGPVFAEPCGDVNSDDSITIIDALMIAQHYVGLNPPGFDEGAADVSGDSLVTIIDALQIAQFYVGLLTVLPGCAEPATPQPLSKTYILQAEEATWNDAAIESDHSGYTGSGYVNTANASGTWIQWTLNVSAADVAGCVFTYASASGDRSMDLTVNGSSAGSLGFPASGGWATWATLTANINLAAGSNTIRLTSTTSDGAPNMDKLDITTGVPVVTPSPTQAPTPIPSGLTPVPGERFIDTYQPEDSERAGKWNNYINNEIKALTVGTGGNGGNKTITNTILVLQGTTYDGRGERITAVGMGNGSQDEGQQPFFLLEPGANLKNITFTAPGVEGVHMMGDNVLENIVWEDVGEDAASVRSYFPGGFIHLKNCRAQDADDKIFQFNRSCIVWFENVDASNMGKFIRTNNGDYFPFEFYLDDCSVSGVNNCIMKVDRSDHTVYLHNFSGSGGWEGGITRIEYGGGGPANKP